MIVCPLGPRSALTNINYLKQRNSVKQESKTYSTKLSPSSNETIFPLHPYLTHHPCLEKDILCRQAEIMCRLIFRPGQRGVDRRPLTSKFPHPENFELPPRRILGTFCVVLLQTCLEKDILCRQAEIMCRLIFRPGQRGVDRRPLTSKFPHPENFELPPRRILGTFCVVLLQMCL